MTIMMLMALASVPPRYSQLLRLAIMAASMHKHFSGITRYEHQILIAATSLLYQASCRGTKSRRHAVRGTWRLVGVHSLYVIKQDMSHVQ